MRGQLSELQPKYRGTLQVVAVLLEEKYRVADLNQDSGRIFFITAYVSQLKAANLIGAF